MFAAQQFVERSGVFENDLWSHTDGHDGTWRLYVYMCVVHWVLVLGTMVHHWVSATDEAPIQARLVTRQTWPVATHTWQQAIHQAQQAPFPTARTWFQSLTLIGERCWLIYATVDAERVRRCGVCGIVSSIDWRRCRPTAARVRTWEWIAWRKWSNGSIAHEHSDNRTA